MQKASESGLEHFVLAADLERDGAQEARLLLAVERGGRVHFERQQAPEEVLALQHLAGARAKRHWLREQRRRDRLERRELQHALVIHEVVVFLRARMTACTVPTCRYCTKKYCIIRASPIYKL